MKKTGMVGMALVVLVGASACGDDGTTDIGADGSGAGDIGGQGGEGATDTGGSSSGTGGSTSSGTGGSTSSGAGGIGGALSGCGDGIEEGDEECDDGNLQSHDGCSSGCTVETLTWTQLAPTTSPPRRWRFGMAYDEGEQLTVIYGGLKPGWPLPVTTAETWEYDRAANEWSEITPTNSPTPRHSNAMSYGHSGTGDWLMSFGGATTSAATSGTDAMDRYWSGTDSWSSFSGPRPGARTDSAMVWDSINERVILFGGMQDGNLLSDTHELAGSWSELNPSAFPAPRRRHSMAFDSARGKVVLFGGLDFNGEDDRTYEYDVNIDNWAFVTPTVSPPPRMDAALIYDPIREVSVLFGGRVGSTALTDTWEYDGTTWTETTGSVTNTPPASSKMVYDARYRRVILLGYPDSGTDNETWEYHLTSDWPDEVCDGSDDADLDGLSACADPDCDGLPCDGGTCSGGTCQ